MSIKFCKHGTKVEVTIGNPLIIGESYLCKDCEIERLIQELAQAKERIQSLEIDIVDVNQLRAEAKAQVKMLVEAFEEINSGTGHPWIIKICGEALAKIKE